MAASRPPIKLPALYLHATAEEKRDAIAKEGLVAGKTQGIGAPETKRPFSDQVFVTTGAKGASQATGEGGPGSIGVMSIQTPMPDHNYPSGSAASFVTGRIPPLREFGQHPGHTYSFVTPMSPRTRRGATAFLNELNPPGSISEPEAVEAIQEQLNQQFPLQLGRMTFNRGPSPTRHPFPTIGEPFTPAAPHFSAIPGSSPESTRGASYRSTSTLSGIEEPPRDRSRSRSHSRSSSGDDLMFEFE